MSRRPPPDLPLALHNVDEAEVREGGDRETGHLIQRSDGVHYTIVNGRVIYEDGRLSGDLPGQVLRGAAWAGREPAVSAGV